MDKYNRPKAYLNISQKLENMSGNPAEEASRKTSIPLNFVKFRQIDLKN